MSDEEGPGHEYGVFGGVGEPTRLRTPEEILRSAIEQRRRDRQQRVSSDFNRHMIELFNRR